MRTIDPASLASVPTHSIEDEIHVWSLAYRPEEGRLPLRRVLAKYLGGTAQQVKLAEDKHGRPGLVDGSLPLGFNWSHSGPHALIAVARGLSPGIDLECVGRRTRALELARRYFSADEVRYLASLDGDERDVAFLQIWTAKEAVLKAIGRGLSYGLHRLSVAVSDPDMKLIALDGEDVGAWQLHRVAIRDDLVAALAWRGSDRRVRIQYLD